MASNMNKTLVTFGFVDNGNMSTDSVEVDGTLNGGRALAAAKRATGRKDILLISVEHNTQKWHFTDNGFENAIAAGYIVIDK